MGCDKAKLEVNGRPLAQAIASRILEIGVSVTVLGPDAIEGCSLQRDSIPYEGPLFALSNFRPDAGCVFVCSCDLPLFDSRLIGILVELIGDGDAAIPWSQGRLQPLCALYKAQALAGLPEWLQRGSRRVMDWVKALRYTEVSEHCLAAQGLSPYCIRSANTPEELARLLSLADQKFV